MPNLSDSELMVLAWPTAGRHQTSQPLAAAEYHRTEQLRKQIDWVTVRQEIEHLHDEIDRQHQQIANLRHQLPRGWFKRSSPTQDLEVRAVLPSTSPAVKLPRFWQLLGIPEFLNRKPNNPR